MVLKNEEAIPGSRNGIMEWNYIFLIHRIMRLGSYYHKSEVPVAQYR